MREVSVRLISAAIGYVGLIMMLRSPEPVRTYALYLPSSILFTLTLDLGRSELALRYGMSMAARRKVRTETVVLTGVGMLVALSLPFSSITSREKAVVGLALSGALQTYVDIVLRDWLFRYRRSIYVSGFQLALACVVAVSGAAVAVGLVGPDWGLCALVFLPLVTLGAFTYCVRGLAAIESRPALEGGSSSSIAVMSLAYKAFPPAAYTAYAAALSRLAPDLVTTARAFYFVFGFIHIRTMARQAGHASTVRRWALLCVGAIVLEVPIRIFASSGPRSGWPGVVACLVLTASVASVFAVFLDRYQRFLDPNANFMERDGKV